MQGVRNIVQGVLWGIPFTQYHVLYYSTPADRSPSKMETPRWRVLYRISRQFLQRVSTASFDFESCRVHLH